MSSIGKIFVVVNLVLSLLLLGSMGALLQASKATQEQVDQLTQEKEGLATELAQARSDLQANLSAANTDKIQLENDKQDLEVAKANLERTNSKLELDNQQLRDDISKLTASYDLLQSDLSSAMQRNKELADNADQLRGDALDSKEAARQAEMAQRDLKDQIAQVQKQVAATQGKLTDAMDRARKAEMLVDVATASGFDPTAVMAMPAIDAVVAQVDNDLGFVILDKGSADQVQKGFTFDVYRGGDFLGRVRVDQVHDKYSTATIVLADAEMRRFDRATTRL